LDLRCGVEECSIEGRDDEGVCVEKHDEVVSSESEESELGHDVFPSFDSWLQPA